MPRAINPQTRIGRHYGRLTVTAFIDRCPRILRDKQHGWLYFYEFHCDCGTVVARKELRDVENGHTNSCGCLARETTAKRNYKHGETANRSTTPEWRGWAGMVSRCYDRSNSAYYKYGERGIKVCGRWLGESGYQNFLADMGRKPSLSHSIDRIKGELDYSPDNCRWATAFEQANNQRSNVRVRWKGNLLNVSQIMRMLGIYTKSGVYYGRLKRGWSPQRAFTTPIHQRRIN